MDFGRSWITVLLKITGVKEVEPRKMFGLRKGVSKDDIDTIPLE